MCIMRYFFLFFSIFIVFTYAQPESLSITLRSGTFRFTPIENQTHDAYEHRKRDTLNAQVEDIVHYNLYIIRWRNDTPYQATRDFCNVYTCDVIGSDFFTTYAPQNAVASLQKSYALMSADQKVDVHLSTSLMNTSRPRDPTLLNFTVKLAALKSLTDTEALDRSSQLAERLSKHLPCHIQVVSSHFWTISTPLPHASQCVDHLARHPFILWMEIPHAFTFYNHFTHHLINGDFQRDAALQADPPPDPCDVSPGVHLEVPVSFHTQTFQEALRQHGINGSHQILGLADSGLALQHTFFSPTPDQRPSSSSFPPFSLLPELNDTTLPTANLSAYYHNISRMNLLSTTHPLPLSDRFSPLKTPYPPTLSGPHVQHKVLAYLRYAVTDFEDDYLSHGTHVAGIAVGRVLSTTRPLLKSFEGIASEARLVFVDLVKTPEVPYTEGKVYIPADMDRLLFRPLYALGARVFSFSWGGIPVYDQQLVSLFTAAVDEFAFTHPDVLIVFAAGNDGKQGWRVDAVGNEGSGGLATLSPLATAKNVLSVGSSTSRKNLRLVLQMKDNTAWSLQRSSLENEKKERVNDMDASTWTSSVPLLLTNSLGRPVSFSSPSHSSSPSSSPYPLCTSSFMSWPLTWTTFGSPLLSSLTAPLMALENACHMSSLSAYRGKILLLLDKTDACTWTQAALLAEKAGARGVIVRLDRPYFLILDETAFRGTSPRALTLPVLSLVLTDTEMQTSLLPLLNATLTAQIRMDLTMNGDAQRLNEGVSVFSGRGPTLDGRIKPDIVVPGESIISAYGRGNVSLTDTLVAYDGTSMATPAAAGMVLLMRDALVKGLLPYHVRYHGNGTVTQGTQQWPPSAALLRAMMVHAAERLHGRGYAGPFRDPSAYYDLSREPYPWAYQGFGRPRLDRMLPLGVNDSQSVVTAIRQTGNNNALSGTMRAEERGFVPSLNSYRGAFRLFMEDGVERGLGIAQGEERQYEVVCDGETEGELSATLVWTDRAMSVLSDVQLTNVLVLTLYDGMGRVLAYGNGQVDERTGRPRKDLKNNVQKIVWAFNNTSSSYRVGVRGERVRYDGPFMDGEEDSVRLLKTDVARQSYAIVITCRHRTAY